jgi:hypothetical protein
MRITYQNNRRFYLSLHELIRVVHDKGLRLHDIVQKLVDKTAQKQLSVACL